MGSCSSRTERVEMVARCKAKKKYMKQLVRSRQALSVAHSMYLQSLCSTGSALLQFSNVETALHLKPQPPLKEETGGSEVAMVVSGNSKDLSEIFKELDEYFLKAADAGSEISSIFEVSGTSFSSHPPTGKVQYYRRSLSPLSWTCNPYSKLNAFANCRDEVVGFDASVGNVPGNSSSHSCTLERLYGLEKKLFDEVKTAEMTKREHEKKMTVLRKLEIEKSEYLKTSQAKKDVESLESKLMVAAQAIESISLEIVELRESELYPQLIELVKRFMSMWRGMYDCHQVQTHIVKQLNYLCTIPSTEPTSEIHRKSTIRLELDVQQWHLSFCNLVMTQRDYIRSLTGWLRLSLFQLNRHPLTKTAQDSMIYSLCEEWQLFVDRMPDKVASDGIKSLQTLIHVIVVQQREEQKQKKRSESAFKELEKKSNTLKALESKYGQSTIEMSGNESREKISDKQAKLEILRVRAEDEKAKHEKSMGVTRSLTLSNLQMGLPNVFEAMTGFTSVCMHAFESICNQAMAAGEEHNMKILLP